MLHIVFVMLCQLGKPTMFLLLSASEYSWPQLLRLLYKLKHGKEWTGEDATLIKNMSADERSKLVNEDSVICKLNKQKSIDSGENIRLFFSCHSWIFTINNQIRLSGTKSGAIVQKNSSKLEKK